MEHSKKTCNWHTAPHTILVNKMYNPQPYNVQPATLQDPLAPYRTL